MAKCILCGEELTPILEEFTPECDGLKLPPMNRVSGYKCIPCGIEWDISEHKNDMNWAVRHIRALEDQVEILKETLNLLHKGGHTDPEKIEAFKKLRETDWTAIRKADIGTEIPNDIKVERQNARNEL
jgi:hypothetical protein